MKVLVLVKQVPDVNSIGFDPRTNRILREGVPLMMNSFDKKAVEEAVRIKERYGAKTVVASMGPPSARAVVNEAMRMGIDEGYLITDKKFGGSDTLATSIILSRFARLIGPDVILMGKYSLDGETSQVPPEVATKLAYNFKSSISKIEVKNGEVLVEHENEFGLYNLRVKLPAVLSVSEKINKARIIRPDTPDFSNSITLVNASQLGIDHTGQEMSPTIVFGTKSVESNRKCVFLEPNSDVFKQLSNILRDSLRSGEEISKVEKPEFVSGRESILGIALDDPVTSIEIASKISSLARRHQLNSVMLGNIDPEKLKGMPTSIYYHVPSMDYYEILANLTNFIRENHPRFVIFPSTTRGRDLASTIAAGMDLGLTADCVDLDIEDGRLIQYKPSFGGSIIAMIYSKTTPEMATVRPGMFRSTYMTEPYEIRKLPALYVVHEEILDSFPVPEEFRPLRNSKIVIGVGRGAVDKETVKKVLTLANMTSAAVGASRPVVDMGVIPRQQQIGLTGYSISPNLYIALGISGMINHVVGLRYAKKIVAVNSDVNAPIFKFADYGIVMDASKFLDGMIFTLGAGSSS